MQKSRLKIIHSDEIDCSSDYKSINTIKIARVTSKPRFTFCAFNRNRPQGTARYTAGHTTYINATIASHR